MVGQANRGGTSSPLVPTRSGISSPLVPTRTPATAYRPVGSQSTSSQQPFVPARAPVEVRRTSSPSPIVARSASRSPSQGAARYLYSPQSTQYATGATRRVLSPSPQRTYAAQPVGAESVSSSTYPASPHRGRPISATATRAGQQSLSPVPTRGGNTPLKPARDLPTPINVTLWPGRTSM